MSCDLKNRLGSNPRIGCVLAGGGARGAYQVGVLESLSSAGVEFDFVAGTSIGALNGAIVAKEQDLSSAVVKLKKIWNLLGGKQLLKLDYRHLLTKAVSMGGFDLTLFQSQDSGLLDPTALEEEVREHVEPSDLKSSDRGLLVCTERLASPPHLGGILEKISEQPESDVLESYEPEEHQVKGIRHAIFGGAETVFFDLTSISEERIYEVLLASAALPVLFPSREILGSHYQDGGLANNIPVKSLPLDDCDLVIIINLSNQRVPREKIRDSIIIDLGPNSDLQKLPWELGRIQSLLNFSPDYIKELISKGREAGRRKLESVSSAAEYLG